MQCTQYFNTYRSINWNYCILDEGHIIKNTKTKVKICILLMFSIVVMKLHLVTDGYYFISDHQGGEIVES